MESVREAIAKKYTGQNAAESNSTKKIRLDIVAGITSRYCEDFDDHGDNSMDMDEQSVVARRRI